MEKTASNDSRPPKALSVACPQCGEKVVWDPASPFRPFCSQRCKMMDLGAWASDSYRIESSEDPMSDAGEAQQH